MATTGLRAAPDRAALAAAAGRRLPDLVGPDLAVLFCGINPSLYSAAVGHHFARPGNRFWRALHEGGFTPRRLAPWDEEAMLALGLGVTNLVDRATARADELAPAEIAAGLPRLAAKVKRLRPRAVAVLGIGAWRVASGDRRAALGRQGRPLAGALMWVLPNPSGLNAHHQPADLARRFAELREALRAMPAGHGGPR